MIESATILRVEIFLLQRSFKISTILYSFER